MRARYVVKLTPTERQRLEHFVAGGTNLVRSLKRAQVLLAADSGLPDDVIAKTVGIGTSSIYRTKLRFVGQGLDAALYDKPRPGARRKLTGKEEALLVATACSTPPAGSGKWTCELLAGEIIRLTEHDSLSDETVRRRLRDLEIKPWQEKMWCIPKVDGEYVARMEDVLDLYAETPPAGQPVVCFDESPVQQIGETRVPIPAEPGKPARIDYEYRRNGTANLFMFLDAHEPWRHVKVTDHRTCADFAECMRDLVDIHYADASCIRVVLDNLSTHSASALYQTFPPEEARRILRRLEFHFVPKHASWLNMVEIEIGVLKKQCLCRRIEDRETLVREVAAWEETRNQARARIRWLFTVEKAREKMGRAYPEAGESPRKPAVRKKAA
jgi:transposase